MRLQEFSLRMLKGIGSHGFLFRIRTIHGECTKVVNTNGYVCYVVGNRTVKGIQLPTDEFTAWAFKRMDLSIFAHISARFQTSGCPAETHRLMSGKTGSTMEHEHIVVLEEGGGDVQNSDLEDKVLVGDVLETLKSIQDNTFDFGFTSPPYNLKNSTGNGMKDGRGGKWENAKLISGYADYDDNMPHEEYVAWQRAVLTEMMRVIKDDGAFFYNHKWRVQEVSCRIEAISLRAFLSGKSSSGDAKVESISTQAIFADLRVIYLIANKDFKLEDGVNKWGDMGNWADQANPHPAPFPLELAERVVQACPGEFVIDPFMGSGTTAVAAMKNGKKFCGIELSQEYADLAEKRIENFKKVKNDKNWSKSPKKTLHDFK